MKQLPKNIQQGFTVVELLVVAPIVILAIGAFLTLVITMTGDVIASRASTILVYNVQDALNRIESDTKLSTTFLAENNIALETGQGYDNITENFKSANDPGAATPKGDILILNMLATTDNPIDTSSGLVYRADQPNDCGSSNLSTNTPLTYNVIYFVKDDSLWRRVVMPANYDQSSVACSTPWQQPSCEPGYSASFCVTEDVQLVDGMTSENFIVDYYANEASSLAITTASDFTDDAARAAALQASATVNVVINANQTAAGQDINEAGSIRASRLDVNATTIAPVIANTAPSVPVVASSYSAPNNASFNWIPSTGGNVTYRIDYQINGGSWVNVETDTTDTSYDTTADHSDTITVRVRASNSEGTSSYGSASTLIPTWVPLALQFGWVNYGPGWSPASYTKTKDGIVLVKGLISSGSTSGEQVIGTLPAGYRPSQSIMFGSTTNPNVTLRIDVEASGDIQETNGNSGWVSLETIRFVPDGRYTRTIPSLANGWTQYGGEWAPGSYVETDEGRVVTQGLVRAGTWTNGTQIFDIPNSLLPPLYMHISTISSGYGYFGIEHRTSTAEGLLAKGIGSSYLSVTGIYYPAAHSSWSNLSLQNSWTAYGSVFSTPQYTKGSDNLVTLKGLLSPGSTSTGTTVTTLPVNFRPKERILFTTAGSAAHTRLDILPTGEVRIQSSPGGSWLSLDGVTFLAEQ